MSTTAVPRDELASLYLDQLPYPPFPVQEEALLAWFTTEQGVLVCAPTGTGKTLIAEAGLFEALHTGKFAYYTTPLIALTEQKFQEMQAAAVRWGFREEDVGLVTGNRRVNPDARVLVVVAEILLNRLLNPEVFDFSDVTAVVMDEFHSFNDPERGAVWELSLGLLPKHVRLLLLSATVGNSAEFITWLYRSHGRRLDFIQSTDRRVPLTFEWVGDQLLNEQIELMADGDDSRRRTPALVFCFNREECWTVAEQLKGKQLLGPGQRQKLIEEVERHNWSQGVGPKLKTILLRGVGVHHAGLLPKYKRIIEHLFQRKLLSVAVCTETLAAGINLPARSVVLTTLIKGPPGDKKLVDPSSAHQICGRAGRPQFDDRGYVFALAHEDDVKIQRWKAKYDTIPEDTPDPALRKAKKALKKKMPTRRTTEQYWNEAQFEKLKAAPPDKLASRGALPWRLLAYLLSLSPDVDKLRTVVGKRMLAPKQLKGAEKQLHRMLLTLWAGGFVTLDPEPPSTENADGHATPPTAHGPGAETPAAKPISGTMAILLQEAQARMAAHTEQARRAGVSGDQPGDDADDGSEPSGYRPHIATPMERLRQLLVFRSVNPLYGVFLLDQLGIANRDERIQAFESVLDIPRSMLRALRVPFPDELPQGPLATERLNRELLQRGLATDRELTGATDDDDPHDRDRPRILVLAEKLRLLFDSELPHVSELRTQPVWAVGELLRFGGDFNKLVTSRKLASQEGIVFRHALRFILLMGEFSQLSPPDADADAWRAELAEISNQLTASCHTVDPDSTDRLIQEAHAADIVGGELPLLR